jgi:hypothetical protein
MTQKLELANVSFSVRPVNIPHPDDKGKIPDKLAEATFTLLHIHKANGDLAWVGDMAYEVEQGNYHSGGSVEQPAEQSPQLDALRTRQKAIDLFREYFEEMTRLYGTEAAWEAVSSLAETCRDPEYITP